MKGFLITMLFIIVSPCTFAGFGIEVGVFSPTTGLGDNDNSLVIGANIDFKFALFGLKLEGFYVDSSGRYQDQLGDAFGEVTDIDMEAMLAADFLFYPLSTTFFLQAGINYISMDAGDLLSIDSDVIDNQLGLEAGLGFVFLDKFSIQGKVLYTPDAIESTAADTLDNLDEDFFGYMVTAGWRF